MFKDLESPEEFVARVVCFGSRKRAKFFDFRGVVLIDDEFETTNLRKVLS
ncbi:MAG: hypothetical protein JRE57_17255 [Deltaproteobacteria bacterium]|nr:hypothetical protein [Deltaproteobacteria bacterium]